MAVAYLQNGETGLSSLASSVCLCTSEGPVQDLPNPSVNSGYEFGSTDSAWKCVLVGQLFWSQSFSWDGTTWTSLLQCDSFDST